MINLTLKGSRVGSKIYIGEGLIDKAGELAAEHICDHRAVIVSDDNVYPRYGKKLENSLNNAGISLGSIIIKAGEESKCSTVLNHLYEEFYKNGLTRSGAVFALGGGVVGDLAGYAAATYMRGVPVVQVPTSLLAQVDSSIGGKTAIDMPFGKNAVGAFHQPAAVVSDTSVLSTLPERYYNDGMAEVIKYGCIKDKKLFFGCLNGMPPEEIVQRCVKIKVNVVESDEFDTGERMLLNFGHTIGHAIEKCENYSGSSHGEAVAVGMVKAAKLGEHLGLTEKRTSEGIIDVLKKYNLPIETPIQMDNLLEAVTADKKKKGGVVQYILLKEIGSSFIKEIMLSELSNIK